MQQDKIIRLPQVRELVGMGTTAIYGKIKLGEFPKQIKLGRLSGWLESEIQDWIKNQAASRPRHEPQGTSANTQAA